MNTNHPLNCMWGTADEIEYLNGIGTHTVLGRSTLDRRELLQAYLKVLKFRPRSERYLDVGRLEQRVQELLTSP